MEITREIVDDLLEYCRTKHILPDERVLIYPAGTIVPDDVREYALSHGTEIRIDASPRREFAMQVAFLPQAENP